MELARHEGWHLELCRHNRAVLETQTIRDNPEKRHTALSRAVLYLVLAPHEPEQADLTHRLLADKLMDEIPMFKWVLFYFFLLFKILNWIKSQHVFFFLSFRELLRLFVNPELIKWSGLCEIYEKELRGTEVFTAATEEGRKRWGDLRNRVVEHVNFLIYFFFWSSTLIILRYILVITLFILLQNIRIMAKYYTKITLKRMSELLDLTVEETESCLCNLVETGIISARTDRPAGVVRFTGTQEPAALLDAWGASLSKLMGLVNHTTHLIHQEEMLAVAQSWRLHRDVNTISFFFLLFL